MGYTTVVVTIVYTDICLSLTKGQLGYMQIITQAAACINLWILFRVTNL